MEWGNKVLYSVPSGDQGQKKKENKRTQHRNSKDRVLHKNFCVQSLWEKYSDNDKTQDVSAGMYIWECVYARRVTESGQKRFF